MPQNSKDPDIRVLVGVEGDVGIDSGSGKLISETLQRIAKNISGRETPQITFGVDFKKTAKKIYKQLSEITESIKLKPIDLKILTNQSSIGTFAEDEYRKVVDGIKGNKAKINAIALAQKKSGLADVAVQKQKDIKLTRKQREETKKLNDITKQFGFLGSTEQSTKYNGILNNIDKLGLTSLAGEFKKAEESGRALESRLQNLIGDTSKMSQQDFVKTISEKSSSNDLQTLLNDIKEYYSELERIEKLSKQDSATFVKESRHAKNAKDLENLIAAMKKYEQANDKFKNKSELAIQFQSISDAAEKLKASGDFSKIDIDGLRQKFVALQGEITDMGLTGQTAFGKIRSQMEKLGVYFGASAIMMGAWRQIKQMTTNVIELDSAMTELKKVTNETDVTYAKFLDNAEVRAKKLGATLVDTVNATADFARLGFSIKEAESISDAALVYKNVGDGINDINEASQSVISTMKAFHIEASQAMLIVDRFNEVGNNFSISSKGIGDGLLHSASALAVAGNDINQSIALITAGNEIVQDPDVVGNMLKTAALRLTSTKGQLEELGEESEGAAESITKLQTQLLNLTKGKVDIFLDADNFKSTYQILLEMSKAFDSMTQKDKIEALEIMFGKHGVNVGASIISNMSTSEKVLETSMNSAGSALSENEKVLSSIQGKMAQFQAQYEAISNTIINSEFIKGAVDAGTGLLGFLTSVVDTLGTIPTLATVAAGSLSALSNKGWLKNLSDKRTCALLQSGGNTERADMFSKRLYGNTSKWLIAKVISSVDNNTDGKVLLIA